MLNSRHIYSNPLSCREALKAVEQQDRDRSSTEWDDLYRRLTADSNDEFAWRALERRVQRWARAAFWGRGQHVIQDAVADSCAAVAVGIDAARGSETFAGFVYGHFLNVRRRLLRDEGFVQRCLTLDGLDIAEPAPNESPEPETLLQLRQALAGLPARERRAVVLRFFDELPAVNIAAELSVTNGNARRIVFNGLRRLRRKLQPAPLSAFSDAAARPGQGCSSVRH